MFKVKLKEKSWIVCICTNCADRIFFLFPFRKFSVNTAKKSQTFETPTNQNQEGMGLMIATLPSVAQIKQVLASADITSARLQSNVKGGLPWSIFQIYRFT